jgi:hypothetical protein
MNEGKILAGVSLEDYESIKVFLVASSRIYRNETGRLDAITEPLEKILHEAIVTTKLDDGTSNDRVITNDFGSNSCLLLIRESKNEGGRVVVIHLFKLAFHTPDGGRPLR